MSTLYDKKKLLDDNKDIYISEYDKSLGYEALAGIIQSKKDYAQAEKNNDTEGMKKANTKANNFRETAGSYTGGVDGSEYNPILKIYETRPSSEYKSSYKEKKRKALDDVVNYKPFSYSPEDDPVFEAYRKLYSKLGNDAYERTLAQNSLRTGGMINSSASSAAVQALNRYNTMLTDKIPELYESAYKRYSDGYERLYKNLEMISDLEDKEYSRYRDDMKDFEADRNYYYAKYRDSASDALDVYRFDTDTTYNIDKDAYGRMRDSIEDAMRKTEMENENRNKEFAELTRLIQSIYGKKSYNNDALPFIDLWKSIYYN